MSLMSLLLPGLFAGLVAIGATVAIERWGGRIGGLLGTLPTTIVPASLGIWGQSESIQDFQAAMFATPAGMLLDVGFLFLWRVLPPRIASGWSHSARLFSVASLTLGAWLIGATALVLVSTPLRSMLPDALFGIGLTALLVGCGAAACWSSVPAPGGSRSVPAWMLLARGTLAGLCITGAIALTSVAGPVAAGIASVFPAMFVTTMVSLWISQGEAVQTGAVGPMMLGSGSVAGFAIVAAWSVPALGPHLGVPVAWMSATLGFTLPAWWYLQWRARA